MSENDAILKVNGLKTYFYQASGVSKAVDGVSFTLKEGTTMGLSLIHISEPTRH